MKDLQIDGHKLLHHEDELKKMLAGKPIVPIFFDLGIHNACNYRCVHCGPGFREHVGHHIKREQLLRLMKDMGEAGVKSVLIGGTGEPSLNPNLVDAVEIGKKHGLDLALTSNGALLDSDKLERMLPHLTWMRFNILATSEEYFYKMHSPVKKNRDTREKVLKNLKSAVQIKKANNLDVSINVLTCVFDQNMNDVENTIQVVKDIGVDYIQIKPPSINQHNVERSGFAVTLSNNYDFLKKLEVTYNDESFSVYVRWNHFNDNQRKVYNKCYGIPFIWSIDGDGGVYGCGSFLEEEKYCFGNINEMSFKEILTSERTREVMELLKTMPEKKYCDSLCRPHTINKFLWSVKQHPNSEKYLAGEIKKANEKPKPDHINFI